MVLKVFGSLAQGVQIALEIGAEWQSPSVELMGALPADTELALRLAQWQDSYRNLSGPQRIRPKEIVHGGSLQPVADCQRLAQRLQTQFQAWLSQDSFRPLDQQLREDLNRDDTIRVLIRTEDLSLQQLPWHSWSLVDRYPQAEVCLGSTQLSSVSLARPYAAAKNQVKILAILGHSDGIDITVDRRLLGSLPQADVTFLVEPERDVFNEQLWNQPWDILFFAGHSLSQVEANTGLQGRLFINPDDSLTISELKYGFRQAINNGLKLAIFNSCDGLGLAEELKSLGLPHLILMREPVPDLVAQSFLRNFLTAYAAGAPLHLAERQARERLQGLENTFPCASWLPVLIHASPKPPPNWFEFVTDDSTPDSSLGSTTASTTVQVPTTQTDTAQTDVPTPQHSRKTAWLSRVKVGLAVAAVVSTVRWVGGLQPLELKGYDWLLAQRPASNTPSRLLVVEATEADVETYGYPLPDDVLINAVDRLAANNPRHIGLDIFRSQPSDALQATFNTHENLIALCSPGQPDSPDQPGIAPPPELPEERIGFSTVVEDPDGVLRRQLLFSQPDSTALCSTRFSLSTLLALLYLESEGISAENLDQQRLRLGQATFAPLEAQAGPYHNAESRGFQIFLDYAQHNNFAERITLSELLNEQTELPDLTDKIVLVGMTAPISNPTDYFLTPIGSQRWPKEDIAGVWLHAHMVNALLTAALDGRRGVRPVPEAVAYGWVVFWAMAGGAGSAAGRHWRFWLLGLGLSGAGLYGLCWLAMWYGLWLPLVPPLIALLGSGVGARGLSRR